jgi:hypothetical protein
MQPFIEPDQPVHALFPDPYFAFSIPIFSGIVLISAVLIAAGCFLVHGELRKVLGEKAKAA